MEYIVEKEQKPHKLSSEEKDSIARKIKEEFRTLDNGRHEQLDKANKLIDEIFFKNVAKEETNPAKKWKSVIKMCKLFMYSQIIKAFIWKNIYANTNSMFDVSGESLESDNNSNKQKTMLVDCLEKMEYPKTCDKIISNSIIYGELISFCTWRKTGEEYRRPIEAFDMVKDPIRFAAAKIKGEEFYIDEKITYDNPYIYAVDPANFVFDTTQQLNWETCPKINRTWRTPDDIINNKDFEVSKEVAQDLRDMVKQGTDEDDLSSQEPENLKDEDTNGSTVEMLEHWGDLELPCGTVLKNWYAVVVGGKYLVRFEKNPFIINPFSYGAYVTDPANSRGISPLYSIYDLALTQEDMLRHQMDLAKLNENKPVYAPKGFFQEGGNIDVEPGKIIEYDGALFSQTPQPLIFEQNVFNNELSYLDDLMSEISGIFPNMAGATEKDRTTATEVSTKVEGQLTRLKMLLDCINQNLILSDVKHVAKLKANFTFGDETVFVNKDNNPENVVINDEVRQSDYRYTYADRSATSERFNYADMIAQAAQMFLKAGLPLNLQEFFTYYMEQKGVENPERFIMEQNLLAPEVQQALMNDPTLAPVIQEMEKRVQMAKQGKELPENGIQASADETSETPQDLTQTLNSLPGRNLLSE